MSASGNISVGDHVISARLPLAGRRVTLRLDGLVAHILSGGVLARTVPCPSPSMPVPGFAAHAPEPLLRPGYLSLW